MAPRALVAFYRLSPENVPNIGEWRLKQTISKGLVGKIACIELS
jgi:hypothetical protein